MKSATEEERLGLVKGDSHSALLSDEKSHSPEREPRPSHSHSSSTASDKYPYQYTSRALHASSPSISDDDDEWQMPSPPVNPSNDYHYHPASQASDRPATPPRLLSNTSPSPPSRKEGDSLARTDSRPSPRRRPSPPKIYRLPQSNTSQVVPGYDHRGLVEQRGEGVSSSSNSSNSSNSRDPTRVRVTPPPSVPSLSLSTSQLSPVHQEGVRRDIRELGSRDQGDSEGEEEGEVLPKKRYEEQSKREREERRKRLSLGPGK
jgi:hypothetical protein